jgi:hypothetical protein
LPEDQEKRLRQVATTPDEALSYLNILKKEAGLASRGQRGAGRINRIVLPNVAKNGVLRAFLTVRPRLP